MTDQPRILAFAGSARRESHNKKLIRVAATATEAAGGAVTLIDLADFPMPLYDGDLEAADGLPEHAMRLQDLLLAHDALLLAAPEYNSGITPLMKNTIDWVSRSVGGRPGLDCLRGKTTALTSASPGALGGLRGLIHLRYVLQHIGVMVLPDQVAVMKAGDAFDADGRLVDPARQAAIEALAGKLVAATAKMAG